MTHSPFVFSTLLPILLHTRCDTTCHSCQNMLALCHHFVLPIPGRGMSFGTSNPVFDSLFRGLENLAQGSPWASLPALGLPSSALRSASTVSAKSISHTTWWAPWRLVLCPMQVLLSSGQHSVSEPISECSFTSYHSPFTLGACLRNSPRRGKIFQMEGTI